MKTRKPRTTGKNMDIDDTSHINGRPYNFTSIAECKIWDRMKKNLCPACGKDSCKCKS